MSTTVIIILMSFVTFFMVTSVSSLVMEAINKQKLYYTLSNQYPHKSYLARET
jgi:hypothetical protein